MTDHDLAEAVGEIVDRAYELLAFESGAAPDWDRFDELFVQGALLALRVFPDDDQISVLGLRDYHAAQMQHGLGEEGYSETPNERRLDVVGDIASVRQSFTMNFANRRPVEAIDVFSLARTAGRWRIVSVVSDVAAAPASSIDAASLRRGDRHSGASSGLDRAGSQTQ
jgi:hypothetical protein